MGRAYRVSKVRRYVGRGEKQKTKKTSIRVEEDGREDGKMGSSNGSKERAGAIECDLNGR